jgi:hypothetical protein
MHGKVLSTVVALVFAHSTALSAMAADDKTKSSAGKERTSAVQTQDTKEYSAALRDLMDAAQKLRDATHELAKQETAKDRGMIIHQVNRALIETHRAMAALPFELQYSQNDGAYDSKAMERLQQAAQRLRDAAQSMAQMPDKSDRSAAIRQTNQALLETHQAMIELLPDTGPQTTGAGARN